MIEIHSRVVSIVRAKDELTSDIVTFTWLSPQQQVQYGLLVGDDSYTTNTTTYAVRFIPSTSTWERASTALHWILQSSSQVPSRLNPLLEFLFPTQLPLLPPLSSLISDHDLDILRHDTDYTLLSIKQQQFVNLVLQRTLSKDTLSSSSSSSSPNIIHTFRPPLMLTGPAGTGKTRTLLAAIRQVLQLNNIMMTTSTTRTCYRALICTPSHTAADVITQRLSKFYGRACLFRLYDADRPVNTVPLPILPYTSFNADTGSFTLPTNPVQLLNYTIIICTCSDAHLLYRMGLTNATLRQRKQCFQNFMSVAMVHNRMSITCPTATTTSTTTTTNDENNNSCTTTSTTSNTCLITTTTREDISSSIIGADELHFTHLFVDEAAQAMEPELLIPLSVILDPTSSGKQADVILVGDPRQLSPLIFSYNPSCYPHGQKCLDLTCPMIERYLLRPNPDGTKADLLGPLCDDNLNTLDDLIAYSFLNLGNTTVKTSCKNDVQSDIMANQSKNSDLNTTTGCIFLTMNYRGHSCFLMMPSALFYEDRLQSKNEGSYVPYLCTDACDQQDGRNFNSLSNNQQSNSVGETATPIVNGELKGANYWLDKIRLIETMSDMVIPSVIEWIYYYDADSKRLLQDDMVNFQKQLSWPMHFRGVLGKDICESVESISGSNSWCNHEEAQVVVDIICKICFEGRASTEDIGVMAPYRSQVVLIRKLLRGKNLGGVNVGTIEDYQGVEKNIIVLSLTRSNLDFVNEDIKQRVGLFEQPMRMNVALTRAENMFVVVGNPHLMARDRLWKQFVGFCHRNGLWYGETLDLNEMSRLFGRKRRHGIHAEPCHVLRKLPKPGVYPGDQEISLSSDDRVLELNLNPTSRQYVLMSSIERRVRLSEIRAAKNLGQLNTTE